MNTPNANIPELDEMKSQISLLKSKLESQRIVNDRLLRQSMKTRLGRIRTEGIFGLVSGAVAMLLTYIIFSRYFFISTAFVIVTQLMLLCSMVALMYYHRRLWSNDFLDKDLVGAVDEIMRLRKVYSKWAKYSLPVVALWYVWLLVEAWGTIERASLPVVPFVIGTLVGGIMGGAYAIRRNRLTVECCDRLLQDIEELRREE